MTFVGEEAVVWRFSDWQDIISIGSQFSSVSADGPFCEDRQHTIVSIDGDTNYKANMDPPVVELNDEYKFFTLNAPDDTYVGTHTIVVRVDLHNYIRFTDHMDQTFDVHVVPSCNSTEFTTTQAAVDNFDNVGIRSGPYVKKVPLYILTTE